MNMLFTSGLKVLCGSQSKLGLSILGGTKSKLGLMQTYHASLRFQSTGYVIVYDLEY